MDFLYHFYSGKFELNFIQIGQLFVGKLVQNMFISKHFVKIWLKQEHGFT